MERNDISGRSIRPANRLRRRSDCLKNGDRFRRSKLSVDGIDIDAAKIMTIGERAEDVFYITNEQGEPLDADAEERLRKALTTAID